MWKCLCVQCNMFYIRTLRFIDISCYFFIYLLFEFGFFVVWYWTWVVVVGVKGGWVEAKIDKHIPNGILFLAKMDIERTHHKWNKKRYKMWIWICVHVCVCASVTIRFIFLKSGLFNNWQHDDFHVLFSHSLSLAPLPFFRNHACKTSKHKTHAQMKI